MKPGEAKINPRLAEALRGSGLALFGPGYRTELARLLAVNPRVIRRWEAKQAPIPINVAHEVRAAVRERQKTLDQLLADMDRELLGK